MTTLGHHRPLFNRPFFDLTAVRLVAYKQVWVNGEEYRYECTWSDGEVTVEHTLPWGQMDGAGVRQ